MPVTQIPGILANWTYNDVPLSWFVANSSDPIQNRHLRGMFFEPDELAIIAKHCPRGAKFVDVGANVGNHAVFMEKIHNAAEVIVFEPNPDAIKLLRLNLLLNDCGRCDKSFLGYALSKEVAQ